MQHKLLTPKKEYQIVLEQGDNVIEALTAFCEQRSILSARFSGIGAVKNSSICFYDLPAKEYRCQTYDDDREVVSLLGNVAMVDGKPFVHAHIALGDGGHQVVGGHLQSCEVAVTLEVMLSVFTGVSERQHNEEIGLKLLSL